MILSLIICETNAIFSPHSLIIFETRQAISDTMIGMQTNIVLDDRLIKRAQRLTGIKTKREVVHEALRALIQLHEQAGIRNLRSKLKWDDDPDGQGVKVKVR